MRVFHCSNCQQLVSFESTRCLHCEAKLGYSPERGGMIAFFEDGSEMAPSAPGDEAAPCHNYTVHEVCNWSVAGRDHNALCRSCRLTRIIPSLSRPENRQRWYRAESAKRRLVVNLFSLGLPLGETGGQDGAGLRFEFKDSNDVEAIMTGHRGGTITLNLRETDDAERERLRSEFQEPYRTVLGHLRHESGHYYWDRLVRTGPGLEAFRALFGDERINYVEALERHYLDRARPDWREYFVSPYASAHPWEDWAETWAHYLHITDAVETAVSCGLVLSPFRPDEPTLTQRYEGPVMRGDFHALIQRWFPLTYILNNLNRGLGLPDAYPFLLTDTVIEKLHFVHRTAVGAAH